MLTLTILVSFLLSPGVWAKAPSAAYLQKAFCPFERKTAKELLSQELLHQLSLTEVAEIFEERARLYGECQKLEPRGKDWRMLTASAVLSIELKFSAAGKVTDFAFGAVELKEDSLKKIEEFGRKAFPRFSFFLEEEEKELASVQSDLPLNVGKSAQLFLLTSLQKRIEKGELKPESTVTLDPALFRLAFGPLKLWPEGTKLSIDSLKGFMMIENDTIASDLLQKAVGRAKIEEEVPSLKPFLSFQEMHALLSELAPARLPNRIKATEQVDLANSILAKVNDAHFQPMRSELVNNIGWFASTKSLCKAMRKLGNEPVLRKTQATEGTRLRLGNRWKDAITVQVREAGLAQSTLLANAARSGKQICLSVTANSEGEISTSAFDDVTDRILKVIR